MFIPVLGGHLRRKVHCFSRECWYSVLTVLSIELKQMASSTASLYEIEDMALDGRHAALPDKTAGTRLVHLRDRRALAPRREPLRARVLVQLLHRAVYPTKADGFIDGVVVRDRRSAACLGVICEPNLFLSCMVPAEPRTPRRRRAHVERFADLHESAMLRGWISSRTRVIPTASDRPLTLRA